MAKVVELKGAILPYRHGLQFTKAEIRALKKAEKVLEDARQTLDADLGDVDTDLFLGRGETALACILEALEDGQIEIG